MNAARLTSFQRCPRIPKLQDAKTLKRWRPRELAEVHLRSGVLALSLGVPVAKITKDIEASFLEQCANPGLDTEAEPYCLAKDWAAILGNIFEKVARETLPKLKLGPNIILSDNVRWECKAFQDEEGLLHRWVMVDRFDSDSLTRELHSWYTDGDRCATQQPMTIHFVEIGRNVGNHQASPWCRIYKHPQVIGRFAFQKKDGSPLEGNWKAAWFQAGDKNKSTVWVDMMDRDKVKLIHHIAVKQPTAAQAAEFVRQITIEDERMKSLESTPWNLLPMVRPACDLPPCPYKNHCYVK